MHLLNYKFCLVHSDIDSIDDEESFCRRYGGVLCLTITCFVVLALLIFGLLYTPRIYA